MFRALITGIEPERYSTRGQRGNISVVKRHFASRLAAGFVAIGVCGVGIVLAACSSDSGSSGSGGTPTGDGGTGGDGATSGPPLPIGQDVTGIATYYDATGEGACSFDATPNDLDVAAMNAPQYGDSSPCGECVAIDGPKGKVTVRIVDKCPECKTGHLDLSESAFAKIADVSAGRVPITWRVVSCSVSGNVSYHYKDGTNEDWTAIQVRNHRLPIAKLEMSSSGTFAAVKREDYNYFVNPKGAGPGPVKVRITSIDGQTIEDTLKPVASDIDAPGSSQFK
jgi:expansin (peptidoglycan-binding protein)